MAVLDVTAQPIVDEGAYFVKLISHEVATGPHGQYMRYIFEIVNHEVFEGGRVSCQMGLPVTPGGPHHQNVLVSLGAPEKLEDGWKLDLERGPKPGDDMEKVHAIGPIDGKVVVGVVVNKKKTTPGGEKIYSNVLKIRPLRKDESKSFQSAELGETPVKTS